jgi:hypothetical protein
MTSLPNSGTAERTWTSADVNADLSGTIAAMAQSSLDLVATGAMLFTIGVYVDGEKAADIIDTLTRSMLSLNYAKSSRYALTNAALAVGRDLVKRLGRPDAPAGRNAFWELVLASATVKEAVALFVSAIKTNYSVSTMQELHAALRPQGKTAPKAARPLIDRVRTLTAKADSIAACTILTAIAAEKCAPADLPLLIENLSSNLATDDLSKLILSLGETLAARLNNVNRLAA